MYSADSESTIRLYVVSTLCPVRKKAPATRPPPLPRRAIQYNYLPEYILMPAIILGGILAL